MANPKWTRKVDKTLVLMHIGSGNWAADDRHLTIGRGSGSHSDWIGRAQVRFSEPDWPAQGRMVRALLTVHEAGTNDHPWFRGGSPRASIKRVTEKPQFSVPSTSDGSYTQQQGSYDRYPGAATGGSDIQFAVSGAETHDVTAMVEEMLPKRILKRDGSPCSDALYGAFRITSSDEDNPNKSFILSDDLTLTVEIKTAVTPDAPRIIEIIGAQEGTSGPTIVGSADGRTLEVRFAYVGAPGDTASKAVLELRTLGATDGPPVTGTIIRTTGSVTPSPGGGTGVYTIRLTGIPFGTEGRFRIWTVSQKGEQGDASSLDDDASRVKLATIPGPPLDIVFQPFTEPHVLFSLNSPNPADYLTGGEVEVTLLPQGTLAWASGMVDIGGTTRRGDIPWGGVALADGQRLSYRVRTRNAARVTGLWSAVREQTVRERTGPIVTPDPGRVTSLRPTFTIASASFDGYRLRLLDATDDSRVLWDSGGTTVAAQTSVAVQPPAGILAFGQTFRAVASTRPTGSGIYGPESQPQAYTVASLPVTSLSVPAAWLRRVGTTDPEWLRAVTDPDGAAIAAIDQEIRVAADTQGTGALVRRWYDPTATPLSTVPGGTFAFESAVDSRARARNDITALAATTLNGALSVGATTLVLTSATGFAVGQDLVIASATAGQTEVRAITGLAGTTATLASALAYAHASGQAVTAVAFGPWSPWVTIKALQPPDVDLITPASGTIVTDPTRILDWSTTGYGGRGQASAVLTVYDAEGSVLSSLAVDGPLSQASVPAYLLDSDPDAPLVYLWDVTVTDTGGMVTTSARWSFTTEFAEPLPITLLSADPDPDTGSVVLSWDDSAEPYIHHYEVVWIADDGSPVRIDGGPESLLDGNAPFIGTSLTHIGARLGDNTYYVSVSNGWRASEPVSVSVTLDQPATTSGWWQAVSEDGLTTLRTLGAPRVTEGVIERYQPPGGEVTELAWGLAARRVSMQVDIRPVTDGALSTTLRTFMADPLRGRPAMPIWLKAPAGWLWDPMWMTLQSFNDSPGVGGRMGIAIEWAELGGAQHAILPPPAELVPSGEPNAYSDESYDYGTVEITP